MGSVFYILKCPCIHGKKHLTPSVTLVTIYNVFLF